MKFNFRKMLLKATSLVVIGAFLFNTVFVDLAWAKPDFFLRQSAVRANDRLQREIVGAIINGLTKEELKEWVEKHGSVIEEETAKKEFDKEFDIINSVLTEERKSELFKLAEKLGIEKEEMLHRIIQARDDLLLKNGKVLKQFPDLIRSSNEYGLGLGIKEYLAYVQEMLERLKDNPHLRAEYLLHEALCYHFQELKGKEGHQIARQIQMVLFPQNYEGVVLLEGDSHSELAGKLTLALREFIDYKIQPITSGEQLASSKEEDKKTKFYRVASSSNNQAGKISISNSPKAQKLQKYFKENLLNAEVSFLVRLIRSNAFLGEKIINTLGKVKTPHSVRLLVQIFDKVEDIWLRSRIDYVLTSMRTDEAAIALGELFDKYVSYRRSIFESLKFIGTPGAIRFFVERFDRAEMYEDEDGFSWHKKDFIFALQSIGRNVPTPEAIKGLAELLDKTEDFSLKVEIIYALIHYYIPESVDCLRVEFEKEDFKPLSSLIGEENLDKLFDEPNLLYKYISGVLYKHKHDFKDFAEIILDTFDKEVIHNVANDNKVFQITELMIALFNMGFDSFLNLNLNKDSAKYFLEINPDLLKDVFEKISKIGVNFALAFGYLINNKRISEIEALVSLDVSEELKNPEYKEITKAIFNISKYDIAEQTELLIKLSKIAPLIKDIPESKKTVLEQFKTWQENPLVSTFGSWAIELIDADIMLLPNLLSSDESIDSLKEQMMIIQNGGFDRNNPVHIDLSYCVLQKKTEDYSIKRNIIYEEFRYHKGSFLMENLVNFLIPEKNKIMFQEKMMLINHLFLEGFNSEIPTFIIRFAQENISHKNKLSFLKGINSIFSHQAMTREDRLDDWQLLLSDYVKRFSYLANRDMVLVHRYLSKGEPVKSDKLSKYQLKKIGIDSTGEKGIKELEQVINTERRRIVEERVIVEDNLDNLLIKAIVGGLTGFYSARWGHGSSRGLDLKAFVEEFNNAVKKGRVPSLAKAYTQKDRFKVHRAVNINPSQEAKDIFVYYQGLINGAKDLSDKSLPKQLNYLKNIIERALEERIRELQADLAKNFEDEKKTNYVKVEINKLKELKENLQHSQHLIDLTSKIVVSLNGKIEFLKNPITLALITQTFNNHPDLSREVLDEIEKGISKGSLSKIINLRNVFIKDHTLGNIDKKIKKPLLNLLNITEFKRHISKMESSKEEVIEVSAFATKGILGEMAGDIGDACYTAQRLIMGLKHVTAVIFTIGEGLDKQFIGSMLILENSFQGKPVLILRGINPSEHFIAQYSDKEFLKGAIAYVEKIARAKGGALIFAPVNSGGLSNRNIKEAIKTFIVDGEPIVLDIAENFNDYNITDECVEISSWGRFKKIHPYINVKFNQEKIDKEYPIVLVVHPNLLFDNLSLALAIQNLKEQLGENIMIVLPYDKPEKVADFCQDINKLTDELTDLSDSDFVVVPADAKPEKVVKIVKETLEGKGLDAEGMKIKVIGPKNWAEPYQEVSGIKELIIVISEVGKGNSISRGDIALLAGLVDEGLLSKEDKDRLLKEVVMSKDRNLIVVKLERVEEKAKGAEDIEAFRKMFEKYK